MSPMMGHFTSLVGKTPHSTRNGFFDLRLIAMVGVLSLTSSVTFANQAPVVDSFIASPGTVVPGATVTLTVTANDPDCADTCTTGCGQYLRADLTHWSSDGGTFTSENNGTSGSPYSATAQWQAPMDETSYTIEVTLADSGSLLCGGRQSTTSSVLILVTSSSNQAPVVESVSAEPPQIFPGETSQLRCFASDPDGDPLTYSWSTDFGILIPGADANAELSSQNPGVATVTCTATDSSGAPGIGSVPVSISDVTAQRAITDGLASPQRLAVDSMGNLFVIDRATGGISVLRLEDGRLMYRIPTANATALAVDWGDRLLVGTHDGVAVLGRDGSLIRQLGIGPGEISDVAVDSTRRRYVVLQRNTGRVVVFDETGATVASFGSTGDDPDQVRSPSGVGILPDGRIVVADTGHGALKVFNLDGTLASTIGSLGSGAGEFVELDDVAVDSRGVIWASDSFQDWVQSFGADGSLREIVGTYGNDIGEFKTAAGIALAEDFGSLVVASVNSSAVQVFQLGSPSTVDWPSGNASVSPLTVLFSAQAVGTTSPVQGLDLLNTGDGIVGVSGVEVHGPFSVTDGCQVVDPNSGCTFDVVFRPSDPGSHVGELVLHTSVGIEPLRVPLNGTAYVPAQLTVDRQQLTFPSQGIGTTSTEQTLVLTNPGTISLNFSEISVDEPFGATSVCGWELAGGSSCVLRVHFSPADMGSVAGLLMIYSDAPDSPHSVSLSGVGDLLELSPQPGRVSFGVIASGTSSPTESIQVLNTGTTTAKINEIYLSGPDPSDFEITTDQCSGNQVDEGQSCWLQVRFTPTSFGKRSAQLMIPLVEGLEFKVDLSGGETILFSDGFESGDTSAWSDGLPVKGIHVDPITVDFGQAEFAATTEARVVTVTNTTKRPVWLGPLQIMGNHAGAFVIDEDYCSSIWLVNRASCWFTVDLLTLDEGAFTARVEIPVSISEGDPPDSIQLDGAVWLP